MFHRIGLTIVPRLYAYTPVVLDLLGLLAPSGLVVVDSGHAACARDLAGRDSCQFVDPFRNCTFPSLDREHVLSRGAAGHLFDHSS